MLYYPMSNGRSIPEIVRRFAYTDWYFSKRPLAA